MPKLIRRLDVIQPDGTRGRGLIHIQLERGLLLSWVRELDQHVGGVVTALVQLDDLALVVTTIKDPVEDSLDVPEPPFDDA